MNFQCSYIISLLLLIVGFLPLQAQERHVGEPQDSLILLADSVVQKNIDEHFTITDSVIVENDSIKKETRDIVLEMEEPPIIVSDSIVAFDTEIIEEVAVGGFKPSSRKAVIYSAIFPGLGQIYNRKYWKLPIIYGGFVGLSYAVTWNHGHYTDYMASYRSILRDDPDDIEWHNHLPYGRDPESIDKKWFTGVLKDRKNYFRYYRDLSIIIAVGVYGLTIVDAYVDAQLFEFDISPDLSMRIEPAVIQRNDISSLLAQGFGFRWSVNF